MDLDFAMASEPAKEKNGRKRHKDQKACGHKGDAKKVLKTAKTKTKTKEATPTQAAAKTSKKRPAGDLTNSDQRILAFNQSLSAVMPVKA